MDDLIQRLRVEPTASQFLRTGDLVESLVAERKEAADRIAALEAEKAEREAQEPVAWQWLTSGHFRKYFPPNDATRKDWRQLYAAPPLAPCCSSRASLARATAIPAASFALPTNPE